MEKREEIYVRPEEDIHSIIDSVEGSTTEELDVIVPSGSRILQNIVDAYLLKDAIEKSKKSVRLVTKDPMGKTFAERAGILFTEHIEGDTEVSENVETKDTATPTIHARIATTGSMVDIRPTTTMARAKITKKTPLKKSAGKSLKTIKSSGSTKKRIKESQFLKNYKNDRADRDSLSNIASGGKNSGRTLPRISTGRVIAGILVLALLVAGTVFAQVLPKADVTLFPIRESQTFLIDVRIDQNVSEKDIENGIVPGELLTKESTLSGEFDATGSADASDRVRGTITITNESGEAHTFIPSRFKSENGLIFRTQETINIPTGTPKNPGTVNALVVADGTGAKYAVGPGKFTLPALAGSDLGEQVYARSKEAFIAPSGTGIRIVAESDIEGAYESLRADLEPQLGELRTALPQGLAVWEEAYNEELAETSSNREPGEQADSFSASIRMVARAIAFEENDLDSLINEIIIEELTEDQTILPKSKKVSFSEPPVVDYEAGTVEATLQISADVIKKIDAESFRGAIVNKKQEEIENILNSYEGVESAQVNLWPFWVSTVPDNKERITVEINGM